MRVDVGGEVYAVRLAQCRRAEESGDSADAFQVDEHRPHCPRIEQHLEAAHAVRVLAGRERDRAMTTDRLQSGEVLIVHGILEPIQVQVLDGGGEADRGGHVVGLRRVDHQRAAGADRIADRGNTIALIRDVGRRHPHLHAAEARLHQALRGDRALLRAQRGPEVSGRVHRDLLARHPEQPLHRLTDGAAARVPDRHVERRERHHREPRCAQEVHVEPFELVEDRPDTGDVLAEDVRRHTANQLGDCPSRRRIPRVRESDAVHAVGGRDPHEDGEHGRDPKARRRDVLR